MPGAWEGSYLLVPGAPDVSGVGVRPRAPHGTEATAQPRWHPAWATAGLGAHLLGRLFLFVLLPLQVLTVGLQAESESGLRGVRAGACVCVCTRSSLPGETQAAAPLPPLTGHPDARCAFVKPSQWARSSA